MDQQNQVIEMFAPVESDTERQARKRVAGANKLKLLQRKIATAKKRLDKDPTNEDLQKAHWSAEKDFEDEATKRLAELEQLGEAVREQAAVNADMPERFDAPGNSVPLKLAEGRSPEQPVMPAIRELWCSAVLANKERGPALAQKIADRAVYEWLNERFVHITQRSASIWYLTRRGSAYELDNAPAVFSGKFANMLGKRGDWPAGVNFEPLSSNVSERMWAELWMKCPYHRQATEAVFEPPVEFRRGKHVPVNTGHAFNLFSGFRINPGEGNGQSEIAKDWERTIHEIYKRQGNEGVKYLIDTMAMVVQRPGVLPRVAIVLRGFEGAGKGFFVALIKLIAGVQYVQHAKTLDQLTGRFANPWGRIVVFADEIVYNGNHAAQDVLLKIVSEDTITCEQKFRDQVEMKNCATVFMATNQDVPVRTSRSARRWAMFQTEGMHRDLSRFFKPQAVKDIAQFLYERDISGFDPRDIPQTEELHEQKLRCLTGIDKWLSDELEADMTIFGTELSKNQLYQRYNESAGRYAKNKAVFFRDLKARIQYIEKRRGAGGSQGAYIKLPSHQDAAAQLAEFLSIPVETLNQDAPPTEDEEMHRALAGARQQPAPAPTPAPSPMSTTPSPTTNQDIDELLALI